MMIKPDFSRKRMEERKKQIVIIGGGVIGASIAYHISLLLQQSGSGGDYDYKITVVEKSGIAIGASGKAGGFLALNWCDKSNLRNIARKSFVMHEELSRTFGNVQDYRKVDTVAVEINPNGNPSHKTKKNEIAVGWLDTGYVSAVNSMGTTETTAQVHPYKFTNALIKAAEATGIVTTKIATVTGLTFTDPTANELVVKSVQILENNNNNNNQTRTSIDADLVIIAMGPWTGAGKEWFPQHSQVHKSYPNVQGRRAHSVVMIPSVSSQQQSFPEISAIALFAEFVEKGQHKNPEVYPRCDGTVYICGESDKVDLPEDPAQINPNKESCEQLIQFGRNISTALKDAQVTLQQACYLPINSERREGEGEGEGEGGVVMGKLRGSTNTFVCSGHSCWGILNSPASGLSMAQLIINGKSDIDLTPFTPS